MKINNKILVIAIIIGLITTLLLYNYISSVKASKIEPVKLTEVVTAVNTIPIHTKVTEEMLTTIMIPEEAVHQEAVVSKEAIVGGITNAEIVKGEQILASRVIVGVEDTPLSYRIPENMRAVTLPMDEITGVGNYIVPGDKIDILVYYESTEVQSNTQSTANNAAADTLTTTENSGLTGVVYTQFENIVVLEKGPNVALAEGQGSDVASSLTVLVDAEQAQMITFAKINGGISFTLRNPVDNGLVENNGYGASNFDSWRDR